MQRTSSLLTCFYPSATPHSLSIYQFVHVYIILQLRPKGPVLSLILLQGLALCMHVSVVFHAYFEAVGVHVGGLPQGLLGRETKC